jgi:hypothetical protein
MNELYLPALAGATIVAISSLVVRTRIRGEAAGGAASDSTFAVSTEGMKVCPKCGMGNMWTDRTCMSCRGPLKG